MPRNIKMNWRGVEEVATSPEMHRAIAAAAEQVADNARAQGVMVEGVPGDVTIPVEVYGPENTTNMRIFDRAKAYVTLAHAAGLATQAKNGTLSKAASAAGLRLKNKAGL